MVRLSINLKKEYIWILVAIVLGGLVVAYGGNSPSVSGHSSGEIDVTINGNKMTLQEAISQGKIGTSCDWSGLLKPVIPGGAPGFECNAGAATLKTKAWKAEKCSTASDPKGVPTYGYVCEIDVKENGHYDLKCNVGSRDFGEWKGERKDIVGEIDLRQGPNKYGPIVEYDGATGSFKLTAWTQFGNSGNNQYAISRTCTTSSYK